MLCEKFTSCKLFNEKVPADKGIGAVYKKRYCDESKHTCARYIISVSVGDKYITDGLLPNMKDKADRIIMESRK